MNTTDDTSHTSDILFNIEFIKEIERHPCLYNKQHGEYNNKPSVDKAWNTVRQKFGGLPVADARLKWRSIRSCYSRSQRTKKDYYLSPYLDFLQPYTKTKPKEDVSYDLQSDDNESELHSDKESVTSMDQTKFDENEDDMEFDCKIQVQALPELRNGQDRPQAKIKGAQSKILSQYSRVTCSRLSPQECYLKSLMPDISSMNDQQFYKFRKGILNIVGKVKYNKNAANTE